LRIFNRKELVDCDHVYIDRPAGFQLPMKISLLDFTIGNLFYLLLIAEYLSIMDGEKQKILTNFTR
jgi:hypothetical protein